MRMTFLVLIATTALTALAQPKQATQNPMIDYGSFLTGATNVGALRQKRRVTEEQFIQMAGRPGTIILDARSAEKYAMLHVIGAQHLSLPDMTAAELARVIPTKDSRVLIYYNNNFQNEPAAFAAKMPAASLNIYTFNSLYSYGYTNVYELGPLIDITHTKLPLEGSRLKNP